MCPLPAGILVSRLAEAFGEDVMSARASEFWGGVRAQLPILLGTTPFGMIYGIAATKAGLPIEVALGMSLFVFAGSSQFVAVGLFGNGTPGLIIVLTTFVVNLRHMLYSASLAPYLRHLNRAWKYLLAFLLTDEAYAVSITHYEAGASVPARDTARHWFTLGAGLTLWVSWQLSTATGVLLGTQVPSSWGLDFTLALTFIALLVPTLKGRADVLAALVAGSVALAAHGLPYNLGLILAALAGIVAGVGAERAGWAAPCAASTAAGERLS
jgi:4-azaleucine resistance transporter AzlC